MKRRAPTAAMRAAEAASEQTLEEVAEVGGVAARETAAAELEARIPIGRRTEVLPGLPIAAELIVGRALLRVFQYLVGLADLFEPGLGVLLLAHVGVVFARELAIAALDLVLRRIAGHAQDFEIVLVIHIFSSAAVTLTSIASTPAIEKDDRTDRRTPASPVCTSNYFGVASAVFKVAFAPPVTTKETSLHELGRDDIGRRDRQDQQHHRRGQRRKVERYRERRVRQEQREDEDHDRHHEQHTAGTAVIKGLVGAYHQHYRELGEQRLDEPSRAEQRDITLHQREQRGEGQEVEHRTQLTEGEHEIADRAYIPVIGLAQPIAVDPVARNEHRLDVGEKIVEQYLLGEQRQKRQKQGRERHADHVAEVGAGGGEDVFDGVGEGVAALLDATAQHVEVVREQHEVGRGLGHVHGLVHRDADVRLVQGRRVVDAVAEIAHDMAGLAPRANDAFLLIWIDHNKDKETQHALPQSLNEQHKKHGARDHALAAHAHRLGDVRRDVTVVARDDHHRDTEPRQFLEVVRRLRLGRVHTQQKADQ